MELLIAGMADEDRAAQPIELSRDQVYRQAAKYRLAKDLPERERKEKKKRKKKERLKGFVASDEDTEEGEMTDTGARRRAASRTPAAPARPRRVVAGAHVSPRLAARAQTRRSRASPGSARARRRTRRSAACPRRSARCARGGMMAFRGEALSLAGWLRLLSWRGDLRSFRLGPPHACASAARAPHPEAQGHRRRRRGRGPPGGGGRRRRLGRGGGAAGAGRLPPGPRRAVHAARVQGARGAARGGGAGGRGGPPGRRGRGGVGPEEAVGAHPALGADWPQPQQHPAQPGPHGSSARGAPRLTALALRPRPGRRARLSVRGPRFSTSARALSHLTSDAPGRPRSLQGDSDEERADFTLVPLLDEDWDVRHPVAPEAHPKRTQMRPAELRRAGWDFGFILSPPPRPRARSGASTRSPRRCSAASRSASRSRARASPTGACPAAGARGPSASSRASRPRWRLRARARSQRPSVRAEGDFAIFCRIVFSNTGPVSCPRRSRALLTSPRLVAPRCVQTGRWRPGAPGGPPAGSRRAAARPTGAAAMPPSRRRAAARASRRTARRRRGGGRRPRPRRPRRRRRPRPRPRRRAGAGSASAGGRTAAPAAAGATTRRTRRSASARWRCSAGGSGDACLPRRGASLPAAVCRLFPRPP